MVCLYHTLCIDHDGHVDRVQSGILQIQLLSIGVALWVWK